MAETRKLVSQDDLGVCICEALGIDPKIVSGILLRIDAGEPGPAEIEITLMTHACEQVKQMDWEEIIKASSVTVLCKDGDEG